MDELFHITADRALHYLHGLETRSVAPTPAAISRLDRLDGPLPDQPLAPEAVLQLLDELGSPATMAMAGPRFFGFVCGSTLPVALAATGRAVAAQARRLAPSTLPSEPPCHPVACEIWVSRA